jgi:2,3-bisphosphoglycerate-independent phosphoglycerate mutase
MENNQPVAVVKEGDAVIHYNFRPDRARQLTKAFVLQELPPQAEGKFDRGPRLNDLAYVMMTEYADYLPAQTAFPAIDVHFPLARVVSESGLRQFHTAETENYAHVT